MSYEDRKYINAVNDYESQLSRANKLEEKVEKLTSINEELKYNISVYQLKIKDLQKQLEHIKIMYLDLSNHLMVDMVDENDYNNIEKVKKLK